VGGGEKNCHAGFPLNVEITLRIYIHILLHFNLESIKYRRIIHMPLSRQEYQVIGRAECLGPHRAKYEQEWNEHFPSWRYAFLVTSVDHRGNEVEQLLETEEILEYYLQAYILLFESQPQLFQLLAETALNVFEVDPNLDLESGSDFNVQISGQTHFIDIAIRRVFQIYGLEFGGAQVIGINPQAPRVPGQERTWFECFNPSHLLINAQIRPNTDNLDYLTDPCQNDWFGEAEELTAERLYQQSRVVVVPRSDRAASMR
jgi:hypothetical protein